MRILNIFQRKDSKTAQQSGSDIAGLISQAKNAFDSGQFDLAYQACFDGIQKAPGELTLLSLAFEIALHRNTFPETLEWLRAGISHHANSADLHFMYGRLLIEMGDFEGALHFLSKAISLNPGIAKIHNSLGATFQYLGRVDDAILSYERALALDPTLWRARYNIGNLLKLKGKLKDAIAPFQQALHDRRGMADASKMHPEPEDLRSTRTKLIHDIEQLNYLREQGLPVEKVEAAISALDQALKSLPDEAGSQVMEFHPSIKPIVAPYYNRLINFYNAPALIDGALNQDQDWAAIEAAYFSNAPGMIFIDHFLKPEALASLRRFCLESTVWFDCNYHGGYVGCTCEDGFITPLLAQIAEEQRLALPSIFGNHHVNGMWGYKYDSKQTGISIHADFAAVNVNFWLTPDDANLNPDNGGLVIWDKEAPLDWDFNDYNNNASKIAEYLQNSGAKQFVVPYRQNRVVLFNSDLFHKTDVYQFKPGFENRRINITMLYGDRQTG